MERREITPRISGELQPPKPALTCKMQSERTGPWRASCVADSPRAVHSGWNVRKTGKTGANGPLFRCPRFPVLYDWRTQPERIGLRPPLVPLTYQPVTTQFPLQNDTAVDSLTPGCRSISMRPRYRILLKKVTAVKLSKVHLLHEIAPRSTTEAVPNHRGNCRSDSYLTVLLVNFFELKGYSRG